MTDFAFNPNEFIIPAGEDITLKVTHDGTMEHSFIVMKYGKDAGEVFGGSAARRFRNGSV